MPRKADEPNSVTISGIHFEGGDLSRPRYESLIRYDAISPRHLEEFSLLPGFQLPEPERPIEVTFELAPDQPFVFTTEDAPGNPVKVRSAVDTSCGPDGCRVPGVIAELVDSDPRVCRLIWDPTETPFRRTLGMQIFCQPVPSRPLSPQEIVWGGLNLALSPYFRQRDARSFPDCESWKIEDPLVFRIVELRKLVIRNGLSIFKPIFELFRYEGIPQEIVVEPALRIAPNTTRQFAIDLDPDLAFFQPGISCDEVGVVPTSPEWGPGQLMHTRSSNGARRCDLKWIRPEAADGYLGRAVSFILEARVDFKDTGEGGDIDIDPTVIEPPPCSPNRICVN